MLVGFSSALLALLLMLPFETAAVAPVSNSSGLDGDQTARHLTSCPDVSCPSGYYVPDGWDCFNWECGQGCPGGSYANMDCDCSCHPECSAGDPEAITLTMKDEWGDGWNNAYWTILDGSFDECSSDCYGQTCDFWDVMYGTTGMECDWYAQWYYPIDCDCSGCYCDDESNNQAHVIQAATLQSGTQATHVICMPEKACHEFHVNGGDYPEEVTTRPNHPRLTPPVFSQKHTAFGSHNP